MLPTCKETAKLDLLVSDEADPEAVNALLEHIEICPTCLSHIEKRNQFYAASSFPLVNDISNSENDSALIEILKTLPGVNRENRIGHFRLIRKLGAGGMGQVFECLDEKLNRRVAVKWIKTDLLSATLLQRLETEARIHASLNHPNIVPLLEFGIAEGMPYLVMELVEGMTLRNVIRDDLPSPLDTAKIMLQVAKGIQSAHDQGILHRDLKSSNILLKPNEKGLISKNLKTTKSQSDDLFIPKVIDFGLAKAMDSGLDHSDSIHLKGTLSYMAPELFKGNPREVGTAADIYSLGVILYESLTGRVPFAGQNLGEISDMIQNHSPPAPRSIQAGVPFDLQTICLKCLEKTPALRYATAAELADDISRFIQHRPIKARPIGPLGIAYRWAKRNPAVSFMVCVSTFSTLMLVASSVFFAYRQSLLRQEAEKLRLQAQSSEARLQENFQLIRDKYFKELDLASDNFSIIRQIVDEGNDPQRTKAFYFKIVEERFDRAFEMINRPELLAIESEYVVEAFYLAALKTQDGDQDSAIPLFKNAIERAKIIAAKRPLNPLGRFCAMNSDNYLGVIADQRKMPVESLSYFRDAWDNFRLLPSETQTPEMVEARLKKFTLMVGKNLIENLTKLNKNEEVKAIRSEYEKIERIPD